MVPCAYLRVFEPLDAFPPGEQERWGRYVADGRAMSSGTAMSAEAALAASRLVTRRAPIGHEAALVRRVGRRVHLCPLQVAERHAVALLAFRELVPDLVVDAFVSPDEARGAVAEVERLERPPHIRESPWAVPLRWFVLFEPHERHFLDPPEGSGPRLVYLTTAGLALDRLDRVIEVVEETIEDPEPIVESLADLVDWLASFDEDSLLELDYGGIARLVPAGDLATDLSCEELWQSIASLERGDAMAATLGYEAVSARWQSLRYHHRAN